MSALKPVQLERRAPSNWIRHSLIALVILWLWPSPYGQAGEPGALDSGPSVSIIIDDLGNSLRDGRRVIDLPGPIVCAILPHTPFATRVANEAHQLNKEVLLHLPMESLDEKETGPGALDATMPEREVAITLSYDLETVPHAVGVNNHMGSLLTGQVHSMRLLMRAMRHHGNLFFVDSLTNPKSQAVVAAQEYGISYLMRNVFLDNERSPRAIERQLNELVTIAQHKGHAVGIGHPYAETLDALERWLPDLAKRNIRLVPLSTLLARKTTGADSVAQTQSQEVYGSWQPSWSR